MADHASIPPPGMSRREWREKQAAAQADVAPVAPVASPTATARDTTDAGSPPTILTVCTGNICRSPMAETLLRARLEPLGVRVHSAGTHALVGHGMPTQAAALAAQLGAEPGTVEAHAARYLVEPMLLESDLILAMAREHRSHAVQMIPQRLRQTFTVREFARLAAGISNKTARDAAQAAGASQRARLAAVIALVGEQKGLSSGGEDDDVIDPYRRSDETYAKSAAQLAPALDEVERLVRTAIA